MLNNNHIQILYNVVLKHCKVTDEEFKGIRRNHNIVTARAMFCYILRKKKFTLKFIADLLFQSHPNFMANYNKKKKNLKFFFNLKKFKKKKKKKKNLIFFL